MLCVHCIVFINWRCGVCEVSMSWFSIFGKGDVINKAANGIDKVIFTDEEKSDYMLKLLKAYEPFKLMQRYLAVMFGGAYLLVWLACAVMFIFGAVLGNGELIQGSDMLAQRNNEALGTPVSLIMSLYFGGGAIEGIINAKWNSAK